MTKKMPLQVGVLIPQEILRNETEALLKKHNIPYFIVIPPVSEQLTYEQVDEIVTRLRDCHVFITSTISNDSGMFFFSGVAYAYNKYIITIDSMGVAKESRVSGVLFKAKDIPMLEEFLQVISEMDLANWNSLESKFSELSKFV